MLLEMNRVISLESAETAYQYYLRAEEKSIATIEKYLRDVRKFLQYIKKYKIKEFKELSKEIVLIYKEYLAENYAPASVNSMLTALNGFLVFLDRSDCCVKILKIQRQIFANEEKELSQEEYRKLLKAAEGTELYYILQTICGTGIRISELEYITAEAVKEGRAVVNCKGKRRVIFLPKTLQKSLKKYIEETHIVSGSIFITRKGNPLNRSNVWRSMKKLCKKAGVDERKVFPHNLRHLFARVFYKMEKDIVRLADVLGHASINTSRLYTMETGNSHMECMERIQKRLIT